MPEPAPPAIGLFALFLKFLRFGALAFGGPVVQIAMLRDALVTRERWIDPARFNRLLAVLQVLPGPEAHELCVHLGMIARGRIGGLLAGLGFMLPGLVLMLLAGWAYVTFVAGMTAFAGPLLGLQVVVLAVIARAVWRIGEHVIEGVGLGVIAIVAFVATLAGVPFWIVLAAAGGVYALIERWLAVLAIVALAMVVALLVRPLGLPQATLFPVAGSTPTAPLLFLAGLKGGLLTFGGAYTAIPYVRGDTVGRGWIGDATFLDGIAIAGLLPAPLVIFATFVGYVSGGLWGALAITAGMFLPAFAFSLIFYERLEAIVAHPALARALTGIAAAVIGIIAATFVTLATATAGRVTLPLVALLLFAAALLAATRLKGTWVTPAILAGGLIAGAVLPL